MSSHVEWLALFSISIRQRRAPQNVVRRGEFEIKAIAAKEITVSGEIFDWKTLSALLPHVCEL